VVRSYLLIGAFSSTLSGSHYASPNEAIVVHPGQSPSILEPVEHSNGKMSVKRIHAKIPCAILLLNIKMEFVAIQNDR
jgi:hypothetical protein